MLFSSLPKRVDIFRDNSNSSGAFSMLDPSRMKDLFSNSTASVDDSIPSLASTKSFFREAADTPAVPARASNWRLSLFTL